MVKNYFTKSGKFLLKLFNLGIVIIYILVTSSPFLKIDLSNGLRFEVNNWYFILTLLIFIGLLILLNYLTIKEIKNLNLPISNLFVFLMVGKELNIGFLLPPNMDDFDEIYELPESLVLEEITIMRKDWWRESV